MGVPKFYRWLSERYPCLSEVVKEYQIPEFDNFYLDMNGIIHNCSHPNDDDVHFRISEEKIFADIFHYLEALFRLVRPRKLFFMAIDGVAPRAKMNQQRGRRFRSAKEAEQREAEARRKGETLPDEARFDSNCITPGTEFMVKLHEQLKYFVTMKISTDPLWQNVQVILSGHQVPGEGEHKIVEYIRHQRSQPGYDCNTRHCLYGLDADLMMLGLCTHEPYFSLLREEVKFGKKSKNDKRPTTVEQTTFHLLHLSLMRDYLDHEFSPLKNKLLFPYNLESIIDDWVLMGFLVGNDFIPHLPNFHIAKGALPMLYNAYMEVMPTLGGYINEGGVLNLQRFQAFMEKVAQIDYDNFNDIYADLKWFEDKRGRKGKAPREDQPTKDLNIAENVRTSDAEKFLAEKSLEVELLLGGEDTIDEENGCESSSSEEEEEDSSESETETDLFDGDQMLHAEFRAHKRNYYMEKLEYADVTSEVLKDQAEGYVRAIQWNLHYYYNGVCSWSWYFPHHYAPYASDIKNFATSVDMNFDLGKPFLPYQQLLGVLPAASRKLLPEAFQSLMTSANSPIIQFYPADFETDKNGKQQEWEAVVLIPFIDEVRLIDAMTECESKITTAEKERNKHGPMQIYFYSDTDLGAYYAPGYFSPVLHNRAACREVPREHFVLPPEKILKGLHPNIDLSICVPGFPTLRHIRHKGALKKAGVTVFNMSSQHESMVLEVEANEAATSIHQIAERILSKTVLINWPHLVEAKVVALADKEWKYSLESDATRAKNKEKPSGKYVKEQVTPEMAAEWRLSDKGLRERYVSRWGVEISTTEILLYVCPILGRKYIYTQNGRVTLEKQWATETVPFCYQMAVMDVQVADRVGKQYRTLEELFPTGSVCFMLGHPGYGSQGQVLSADPQLKGKLRVSFSTVPEPNYEAMRKKWRSTSTQYLPAYAAARASNMSSHLLSRITGTVYINLTKKEDDEGKDREKGRPGRVNVGLNLKFNKKNEEVPGWSRKSGTTWLYSQKTIETLRQYVEKFPEFFDYVSRNVGNDVYDEKDLFPGPEGHSRMCELIEWVQGLPCLQAERQACGTFSVEQDLIPEIAAFIGKQDPVAHKPIVMQVRPHLLYKPSLSFGPTIPDPSAKYQLLDRVVNVREGFCVPLGLKGTVISIKTAANPMDEIYEILFDSEFSGGMTVKGLENSSRIYRLPPWALINISHGRRVSMEREMQGRPIAVVYPTGAPEAARQGPGPRGPPQARPEAQAKTPRPKTDEPRGKPSAAPAPSLLPKPQGSSWRSGEQQPVEQKQQPEFDAIWKALSKQQPPAPARGPQVKEKQNQKRPTQQEKSQNKPFPSLQEAAKALPQIPKAAAETKKSTAVPAKSVASEQKPAAVPAPPPVQGTPAVAPVLGPSLSVQDLFQMAGQGQVLLPPPPVPPVIPIQAPVVSNCIQLLNFCQQKALGVPLYTYVPLNGSFAAEIKLPCFGVISKATGVSQEEAAEKAAAIALQHPVLHQPLAMAVPFPGVPVMHPHFGPLPPHPMPAPFPLMGFPQPMVRYPTTFNNLVPLQVTRQKVHQASRPPQQHLPQQQPHRQQQPQQQQRGPRKSEPRQDPETAQTATTLQQQSADPGPAVVAPASVPSEPRKIVNAGKPPGSRLAIRFGSPGK